MLRERNLFAALLLLGSLFFVVAPRSRAQSSANAGSVEGTVLDPDNKAIVGAAVEMHNPVSGYDAKAITNDQGHFRFSNVPFNPYHMTVNYKGFQTFTQDVDVRSGVPIALKIGMLIAGTNIGVTVEAGAPDLLENVPTDHTDVDKNLFAKLPLESQSSSVSSLITLSTPGIAADSNGLFHGMGDHASNSFSVDGQPITDQQSKIFSNQIPLDSIQSLEVISGAPPPEFGGKTSVVIVATTRSGMGVTPPHGDVTASYGSFGSPSGGFDLSYGGANWGNFVAANGLDTGRFLDPPEFVVMHDKGNEENVFDRFDFKTSQKDAFQINVGFTRSWFQTPNTFDQQTQDCTVLSALCNGAGTLVLNPVTGLPLSPTDQRSQIRTYNVAPSWSHTISTNTLITVGAWVRHDEYNYYPSNDLFSDLGPLQDEAVGQFRLLTNVGGKLVYSYVKGIHNIQVGGVYEQTFLTENDTFGIVNPGLLSGLGCPNPAIPNCAILAPVDLTNGGHLFTFRGHTDVKETGLYIQDAISVRNWTFMVGIRGDLYNGLRAASQQAEPRAGISYNIKKTGTVLRVSYARTMESPFNENLILSGTGCNNAVVAAIMQVAQGFPCGEVSPTGAILPLQPLTPGFRNEFHAGLEQAFGRYFVLSGEYVWKYTHNGFDFNVFGTTPIFLPIEWASSKIPGVAVRGSLTNFHGLSAFIVMSHVNARFFPPTVAGIAPPQPPAVFRIDHDEAFNQTTHIQYQPWKRGPWFGFNWRYDSGLVAGFVPCLAATSTCSFSTSVLAGGTAAGGANVPAGDIELVNNLNGLPLTADQEFEAGLVCQGVAATPTKSTGFSVPGVPFNVCPATQLTSSLIKIPAPGTENDDHNPQRIAPRNLFDVAVGDDNLFHTDKYRWSARFTVINVTNADALYNYLSTFSGTHYVTPRTFTGELGFHF
jgi:hypothetical protein